MAPGEPSKGKFLGQASLQSSSNVVSSGLGFLGGFLLARILGPYFYGLIQSFKMLYQASGLFSLGVDRSLAALVPLQRARGGEDAATTYAATGLWILLGSQGLASVCIFAWAWVAVPAPGWIRFGYLASAATLSLLALHSGLDIILLAREQIRVGATMGILRAVTTFVVLLPGAFVLGPGAFWVAEWCAAWVVIPKLRATRARDLLRFSRPAAGEIVRLGLPLYVNGQLAMLTLLADRFVVVALIGAEAVGYYAIGNMATGLLMVVIHGATSVWAPRAMRLLGAGETALVRQQTDELARALGWLGVILATAGAAAVLLLVPWLLPRYTAGILPALLLLPGLVLSGVGGSLGNTYVFYGWQVRLLGLSVAALVLGVGLDLLALDRGWGLAGVALMTTASRTLVNLGSFYLCWRLLGDAPLQAVRRILFLLFPLAALVVGLPCCYLAAALWGPAGAPGRVLAASALFALLVAPALWGVWRDLELGTRARALWVQRRGDAPGSSG